MATISLTKIKNRTYSIRWRFLIAYLLIICCAFYIIARTLYEPVGDYLYTQREAAESEKGESFKALISDKFFSSDSSFLLAEAQNYANQNNARVFITNPSGVILIDTLNELNASTLNLDEVFYSVAENKPASAFYKSTPYRDSVSNIYVSPILNNDKLCGLLCIVSDADDIYTGLIGIYSKVYTILIIVALVTSLLTYFILNFFTRPIGELKRGIQSMAKGELSARVSIKGHNEFSELGRAFNNMCARLETLDSSRNQFVSNASHELKTPLATMKILIQTLTTSGSAPDPIMTAEFLKDIESEIDRLNNIITDLLAISKNDMGDNKLKAEPINLDLIIKNCVRMLEPLAREHGIELDYSSTGSLNTVADKLKLEQVFYNLVDNAIKYTGRGGKVHVTANRAGSKAIIKVQDNGIGIPQDDIEHIFERFYRVDKARSRETGGTGLGLSIVKQIVSLHMGEISVESREGQGSLFTVELPLVNE